MNFPQGTLAIQGSVEADMTIDLLSKVILRVRDSRNSIDHIFSASNLTHHNI